MKRYFKLVSALQFVCLAMGSLSFALENPTETTKSGWKFTRRIDLEAQGQGEIWEDPDGYLWYDVAKKSGGEIEEMTPEKAKENCEGQGLKLPSYSDFSRLAGYMSDRRGNYKPQILPNLAGLHCTSSKSNMQNYVIYFDPSYGDLIPFGGFTPGRVRCGK